jgi:hypothetical protein
MPSKVPPDKLAKVLAHYELTGNASEAGRRVDVPERTAQKWVADALERGELADSGAKLRARALDAVSRMMLDGVRTAYQRLTGAWCTERTAKGPDPGPQYLKAIVDAHRSLVAADARIEERLATHSGRVIVQLVESADADKGSTDTEGQSDE